MIKVTNLTKKYGNDYAIKDLNFSIEKGQIYGFLGPNGAGKSTTMNILTGYIAATQGKVVINGHDILEEPREARACIGYLPEQPPLYMDMTVEEYLLFAAELKRIPKENRKSSVDYAMNKLAIEPMAGRLIKNLSKGYKQRVGFAQALLGLPEIIILDEPTVGLDPKQIIEIRSLIRSLGQDHTIILSSHILSEVSEVCDHILIISNGQLAASDSTEELLKKMQPVTMMNVTVVAEEETVRSVLDEIEAVSEYTIRESAEQGILEVEIRHESDQDLRIEIAKAFTDKGATIIEMTSGKASLEDIFLELTSADDPASEENEDPSGEELPSEVMEDSEVNPEDDESGAMREE